jgi:acyl-coenzyme A thioesterase PaaI-like protein
LPHLFFLKGFHHTLKRGKSGEIDLLSFVKEGNHDLRCHPHIVREGGRHTVEDLSVKNQKKNDEEDQSKEKQGCKATESVGL